MKKLLLALFILALLAGPALAITPIYEGASGMGELKTVVLINTADAGAKTDVSTSYVIPGKVKILGVSANDTSGYAATEVYVALSDELEAGLADTDSSLMAELEANNKESIDKDFPQNGLSISSGLSVRQGAKTCVTIYYIQVRP